VKFVEKELFIYFLFVDFDKVVFIEWGVYGEKKLYGKMVIGVICLMVVVGEDGMVEFVCYNVKVIGYVVLLRNVFGVG